MRWENEVRYMLKNWNPVEKPKKTELKERLENAEERLYQLQMKIKEDQLPVIVLFIFFFGLYDKFLA